MHILLIIGIIILVIIVAMILSWPTIKPMAINYASRKIMDYVKIETPPAEMQISECGTYGTVKYNYLNSEYTLYIPFEKKLLRKIGVSVYHSHNGQETEITHQPGIPILITANSLGGGSIIIKKSDEVINKFTENQIVVL